MRSALIYIVIFFIFLPSSIYAQTIRNEIKINSTTGGNTVNGETDGSQVTTGSTTTSVNIKNNSEQVSVSSDTSQDTTSTTKLDIQTSGSGKAEVNVNLNTSKYSVVRENGHTTLTTTKSDGTSSTRTLEDDETLRVGFEDLTRINISSDENGFRLVQNQSQFATELPLSVDIEREKVRVLVNGEEVDLDLYPEELESFVIERKLLDNRTGDIRLENNDNTLQYIVSGTKNKKILRLLPVTIQKTLIVSTRDRNSYQEVFDSSWQKFLDIFSD